MMDGGAFESKGGGWLGWRAGPARSWRQLNAVRMLCGVHQLRAAGQPFCKSDCPGCTAAPVQTAASKLRSSAHLALRWSRLPSLCQACRYSCSIRKCSSLPDTLVSLSPRCCVCCCCCCC